MTDDDTKSWPVLIGGLLVPVLALFTITPLHGWMIFKAWTFFVEPVFHAAITYPQAIGLGLMVEVAIHQIRPKDDYDAITLYFHALITTLWQLGVVYFVNWWFVAGR